MYLTEVCPVGHTSYFFALNLLTHGSRPHSSNIPSDRHSESNRHSQAGHYRRDSLTPTSAPWSHPVHGIRRHFGDVIADHQKRHGSSSLMWLSSSYHILQSGARAALILLTTQLWQRAGCKRPECRIKDSVLPPCRKVHREPFQLLCKNHQPFPQMVVMWSIKRLGRSRKMPSTISLYALSFPWQ